LLLASVRGGLVSRVSGMVREEMVLGLVLAGEKEGWRPR
jgi:hypothetical protein